MCTFGNKKQQASLSDIKVAARCMRERERGGERERERDRERARGRKGERERERERDAEGEREGEREREERAHAKRGILTCPAASLPTRESHGASYIRDTNTMTNTTTHYS